jgi:hypothetical protein
LSADFFESDEALQGHPNLALDRRQNGDVSHPQNLRRDRAERASQAEPRPETGESLVLDPYCWEQKVPESP